MLSPFEWWCRNFILPDICKPCLFVFLRNLFYLTAEIEENKKKIRQFENREKIIKQKLSVEERKARNHRLCKRGGFMESLVPELITMPDEDAKAFLRLALTSEPAQEFLKKRAENGNAK